MYLRTIGQLFLALVSLSLSFAANSQSLPVGSLAHDGPPTPEQLSLVLPVTGSLSSAATATVRYKRSQESAWTIGHPLFRVRPEFSQNPSVGSVDDVFAWPILGLDPGTTYDVEVTVSDGSTTVVRNGTFSTRRLPATAGTPNKIIVAGSSNGDIQTALANLDPGDILEFENGTYNVNNIQLSRSGTAGNPIYIRGASRNGVVLRDTTDSILRIGNASHVIIENLTLSGSGTDGGTGSFHTGIHGGGSNNGTTRNTIRNVTITGVDKGIVFWDAVSEALIYNNSVTGTNRWEADFLNDNRTWNDDGVNVPGLGNAVFNNTVTGFGDSFAYASHSGGSSETESRGVHFYRNEIRNSLDDLVEVDHGQRNLSFYDNRSRNSSNCGSLDPLYGGPYVYARNICINPARTTLHKWNAMNSGHFYYNNTFVISTTAASFNPDLAAWWQPNNGQQRSYGFRNNLTVYRGSGILLWLDSRGHSPIDWTHNSWYPDEQIQWGDVYGSLSSAQSGLSNSEPVFSGTNRRMENDNITVSNPWTLEVLLGPDSLTEVTQDYVPRLSASSSPKNSGAVIPNITDNFSGPFPDRGAIIDGRPITNWGDQGLIQGPPPRVPNAPSNLDANPK